MTTPASKSLVFGIDYKGTFSAMSQDFRLALLSTVEEWKNRGNFERTAAIIATTDARLAYEAGIPQRYPSLRGVMEMFGRESCMDGDSNRTRDFCTEFQGAQVVVLDDRKSIGQGKLADLQQMLGASSGHFFLFNPSEHGEWCILEAEIARTLRII